MTQIYEAIGAGYDTHRRADPRIAAAIREALGSATTVVNVGAGAGSYEPADRGVVAVEPARAMIQQRGAGAAPVVQAEAAHLPFATGRFDAALAVLTVHHWPDRAQGLREMRRVSRDRIVIVTWDPATSGFWLVEEYFPAITAIDRQIFPSLDELERALGRIQVLRLPVPHDCSDGFLGAYWRRPHAYLDAGVRFAMSTFSKIADVDAGVARLERDLRDGTWTRCHADLLGKTELDLGYRLVVAEM